MTGREDDYSKSGPKTPSAEAKNRANKKMRLMSQLLELEDEKHYVAELNNQLGITPQHPAFGAAIKIWKAKHFSR